MRLQDEAHARFRIAGLERHVRRPGLQDPQHRDDQLGRTLEQHRDRVSGSDAFPNEVASQPVRRRFQVAIAQVPRTADHRCGVFPFVHPAFEELVEQHALHGAVDLAGRVVPFGHELVPLAVGQDLVLVEAGCRPPNHRFEQRLVVTRQPA